MAFPFRAVADQNIMRELFCEINSNKSDTFLSMNLYSGLDRQTTEALRTTEAELRHVQSPAMTVHTNANALAQAMAACMLADYQSALASGRSHCVMIVPVGPVGHYQLLARLAVERNLSLASLVLILMDEYLSADGHWIAADNPLSFRGHLQRHLLDALPSGQKPQLLVPDPFAPEAIQQTIVRYHGVDYCYAGVGITGHLAFNEPIPGRDDADWFASLPTRVVNLLPQTRLINSVTAARGNIHCIPEMAVTVGMKEILSADTLRVWMNRDWQCAAIRRLLLGPRTAQFPASLLQNHTQWSLDVTQNVLQMPEPTLA